MDNIDKLIETVTSQEVKDGLMKAHDLMTEKGWATGANVDSEGHICPSEAIARVLPFWYYVSADEVTDEHKHGYTVRRVAQAAFADVVGSRIIPWNDTGGRRSEEAFEAFKTAAAKDYTQADMKRMVKRWEY